MVGFREIRSLRYAALFALVGLGACTSVLGIEDLHDGPRPGGEGATGATSNNGGANNKAGNGNGGANTTAGTNGEGGDGAGNNGGTNNGGTGATSNTAGTTNEAGAGGEPPVNTDPTVHGTLIDVWGKALGNTVINLGDEQTATDKDGKFTFENAPAEYDVSLKVATEGGGHIHAWYFQGLTRRDPTLQIYRAREETYTTAYLKATSPALLATDTIAAAIGGADGNTEKQNLTPNNAGGNYFTPNWVGGTTTQATAHALLWAKAPATGLPTSYKGYDTKLVALEEGSDPGITFDLKAQAIVDGDITGSVTPFGNADRKNLVFLRFESGASIQVVDQTPTSGNAFQFKVPTLTKCSITVAASEGDTYGAYGLVHKDGLTAGADAGTLVIPAPATPSMPATSLDMVDNTTDFTFSGSADSKGGFVVHIEATKFFQDMHIVTSKKKFKLPVVPGYDWVSGRVYYWQIETHGTYATADQMAGPNGFADAFAGAAQFAYNDAPQGLRQASGSFTQSDQAFFTFK